MDAAAVGSDISKLNLEQIITVVSFLNENNDIFWREKMKAIFNGLSNREQLVCFGRALNHLQAMEILDEVSHKESIHYHKFLPILVGMSHKVFEEILLTGSERQMQVLKLEGITEAIQHHMTVLLHDWVKDIEGHSTILRSLLNEISFLDVHQVTRGSLDGIRTMLISITEYYQKMVYKTNRALSIAWNTNRPDLIEKFTMIKDSCMKYHSVVIGNPHTPTELSTGLYELLDKRLDDVYSSEGDPLENDDPAIEGLTKLGIWYLDDYVKIGLLPGAHVTEEEGFEREKFYELAVENLANIGLSSVHDLKRADIFSKNMLVEYIREHHHQLTTA